MIRWKKSSRCSFTNRWVEDWWKNCVNYLCELYRFANVDILRQKRTAMAFSWILFDYLHIIDISMLIYNSFVSRPEIFLVDLLFHRNKHVISSLRNELSAKNIATEFFLLRELFFIIVMQFICKSTASWKIQMEFL